MCLISFTNKESWMPNNSVGSCPEGGRDGELKQTTSKDYIFNMNGGFLSLFLRC